MVLILFSWSLASIFLFISQRYPKLRARSLSIHPALQGCCFQVQVPARPCVPEQPAARTRKAFPYPPQQVHPRFMIRSAFPPLHSTQYHLLLLRSRNHKPIPPAIIPSYPPVHQSIDRSIHPSTPFIANQTNQPANQPILGLLLLIYHLCIFVPPLDWFPPNHPLNRLSGYTIRAPLRGSVWTSERQHQQLGLYVNWWATLSRAAEHTQRQTPTIIPIATQTQTHQQTKRREKQHSPAR